MAKTATPAVVTTVTATEALTAKRFVTHDGKHTNITRCLGVSLYDCDNAGEASVAVGGTAIVILGATLTVGAAVTSDANGKAVAAGTDPICGHLLTGGNDGDEAIVHLV